MKVQSNVVVNKRQQNDIIHLPFPTILLHNYHEFDHSATIRRIFPFNFRDPNRRYAHSQALESHPRFHRLVNLGALHLTPQTSQTPAELYGLNLTRFDRYFLSPARTS